MARFFAQGGKLRKQRIFLQMQQKNFLAAAVLCRLLSKNVLGYRRHRWR